MGFHLLSLESSNLQRESKSTLKVDVVVDHAAQVDEVVQVDRFNRIADLFLSDDIRSVKLIVY